LQVETIEFALQYSASLAQGYTATTGTENFAVAIPRSKFVFGYPAQPQASTTGFIDPTAVTAMVSEASIHAPLRFHGAGLL
jgi:chitinase